MMKPLRVELAVLFDKSRGVSTVLADEGAVGTAKLELRFQVAGGGYDPDPHQVVDSALEKETVQLDRGVNDAG